MSCCRAAAIDSSEAGRLRGGFLDGMAGLIVAVLATHYVFLKDAKLWDLQLGGGREGRR